MENNHARDFLKENEARWSLVETAWRLNLSENLISLNYDHATKMIMEPDKTCRRNITRLGCFKWLSKRPLLLLFLKISISSGHEDLADVDHFLPHVLANVFPQINFDGV